MVWGQPSAATEVDGVARVLQSSSCSNHNHQGAVPGLKSSAHDQGGDTVENSTFSTSGNAGINPSSFPQSNQGSQPGTPIIQQTRQKAGEVMDQARDQVTSQLESQKERVTSTLSGVADALRQTGEQLRQQNQEPVGHLADRAADAVTRISGYLHERDIRQIVGSVESYAREQPAVFIGGAFALGLLMARFLKSSSDGAGSTMGTSNAWTSNYAASVPWSPPATTMAPVNTYNSADGSFVGAASTSTGAASSTGGMSSTPSIDADDDDELIPATAQIPSVRSSDDA